MKRLTAITLLLAALVGACRTQPEDRASKVSPRTEPKSPQPEQFTLRMKETPAATLMDFLGKVSGRTVLHPLALPAEKLTMESGPVSAGEAFKLVSDQLEKQGITVRPVGEKFLIVEAARVDPTPLAQPLVAVKDAQRSQVFQPTILHFTSMDIGPFLNFYEKVAGVPVVFKTVPSAKVTLNVQSPLTRQEIIQAMDTVLLLNGIKFRKLEDGSLNAVARYP